MLIVNCIAVTATSTNTFTSSAGQRFLSGFFFTETSGTNSITVTIRANSVAGAVVWKCTIPANSSVGEDYAHPIGMNAAYVDVSGSGTCQGHVRGR